MKAAWSRYDAPGERSPDTLLDPEARVRDPGRCRPPARPTGRRALRGCGGDAEYGTLLEQAAAALADVSRLDLTVELITQRFTETSRAVLLDWYPRTKLDLHDAGRSVKRTKFGGAKYVYPAPLMREMRTWFEQHLGADLPQARLLYWT